MRIIYTFIHKQGHNNEINKISNGWFKINTFMFLSREK